MITRLTPSYSCVQTAVFARSYVCDKSGAYSGFLILKCVYATRQGRKRGAHVGAGLEGRAHDALVGSAAQSGAQVGDFLQHRRAVSQSAMISAHTEVLHDAGVQGETSKGAPQCLQTSTSLLTRTSTAAL